MLPYGVELAGFAAPVDPRRTRADLGIPADAFVLGHVGRFHPQKNHAQLVAIAAEVRRREPRVHLLLVGAGRLQGEIERQVAEAGLADRVTFAGVRNDVPALMRGAMDAFVLPSRYEGLGLVGVEAQAAGLPVFCSHALPAEMEVVPGLVTRLASGCSAGRWATAILAGRSARPEISAADALETVRRSPFEVGRCVARLEAAYRAALAESLRA